MENAVYRFRRLEHILGASDGYANGFDELRRQIIYFASPEELNDPIEGLKYFIWRGDEIIWKRFLKHYVMCLEQMVRVIIVNMDVEAITPRDIPVEFSRNALSSQEIERHERICQEFFANVVVSQYPSSLAERVSPVRKNELLRHLQILHVYALKCIHKVLLAEQIVVPWGEKGDVFSIAEEILQEAPDWNTLNSLTTEDVEALMLEEYFNDQRRNFRIINQLQYVGNFFQNVWFLVSDFPGEYLNQLERLVHVDWYSASFTRHYKHSSIWSHYTNNHKGVCLKYRANNIKGRSFLSLIKKSEFSGTKESGSFSYDKRPYPLHDMHYESKHMVVDFFRSLATLPTVELKEMWFFDENMRPSICHNDVFVNEEVWRKEYWENFHRITTLKTKDWEYEAEQRIILAPMLLKYNSKDDRCIQYEFSELDGIIFGIKTPIREKVIIRQIIEEQCRKLGRTGFRFYQAYYSTDTEEIKTYDLHGE